MGVLLDVHLPSLGDREAYCCKLILFVLLLGSHHPVPSFLTMPNIFVFSSTPFFFRCPAQTEDGIISSFFVSFVVLSTPFLLSFLSMPTFLLISPFLLFPYVFLFLPFPHGRSAFVLTLPFFSFISFLFVFFLSLFTWITLLASPLPIRHSLMLSNVLLLQGMTIANI